MRRTAPLLNKHVNAATALEISFEAGSYFNSPKNIDSNPNSILIVIRILIIVIRSSNKKANERINQHNTFFFCHGCMHFSEIVAAVVHGCHSLIDSRRPCVERNRPCVMSSPCSAIRKPRATFAYGWPLKQIRLNRWLGSRKVM